MAEEQNTPAGKEKLPTKTRIAAWALLIMAAIVVVVALGFFVLMAGAGNEDISMYAPFPLLFGFGIALFYFLPGILLLKSRSMWAWILSVVILFAGMLIPFAILLRNLFDFLHWGLPPNCLGGPYEAVCVCFVISFVVLLILVLLDKLSYKFVIPIPVILVIIALGCFFGVAAEAGSRYDQATGFETRMYTELYDLYGKAVEDGYTEWCQSCEEVNQYFNEQWNQLAPDVREQSNSDIINEIGHKACLKAIAVMTENISVCDCLEAVDGSDYYDYECKQLVQALVADDVSICNGDYGCIARFAIMTDNPSLCDQVPYYDVGRCHAWYNESQEDPYNYLGLFWVPPQD